MKYISSFISLLYFPLSVIFGLALARFGLNFFDIRFLGVSLLFSIVIILCDILRDIRSKTDRK